MQTDQGSLHCVDLTLGSYSQDYSAEVDHMDLSELILGCSEGLAAKKRAGLAVKEVTCVVVVPLHECSCTGSNHCSRPCRHIHGGTEVLQDRCRDHHSCIPYTLPHFLPPYNPHGRQWVDRLVAESPDIHTQDIHCCQSLSDSWRDKAQEQDKGHHCHHSHPEICHLVLWLHFDLGACCHQ